MSYCRGGRGTGVANDVDYCGGCALELRLREHSATLAEQMLEWAETPGRREKVIAMIAAEMAEAERADLERETRLVIWRAKGQPSPGRVALVRLAQAFNTTPEKMAAGRP